MSAIFWSGLILLDWATKRCLCANFGHNNFVSLTSEHSHTHDAHVYARTHSCTQLQSKCDRRCIVGLVARASEDSSLRIARKYIREPGGWWLFTTNNQHPTQLYAAFATHACLLRLRVGNAFAPDLHGDPRRVVCPSRKRKTRF